MDKAERFAALHGIQQVVDGERLDRIIWGLQNCHKKDGIFYPRADVKRVLEACQPEELLVGSIKQVVTRLCDRLIAYINRPASEVLASSDPIAKKLHAVAYLSEMAMVHRVASIDEILTHHGVFHLLTHVAEGRPVKGGMRRLVRMAQILEVRLLKHGQSIGGQHQHDGGQA